MTAEELIVLECDTLKTFLLEKNKSYGNSAFNPLRIFSKVDRLEQIKVRIDDKLSRLARGKEFLNDDTVIDLIGYLIILRVATYEDRREAEKNEQRRLASLSSPAQPVRKTFFPNQPTS